uniref:Nibrin second BRCT domain-containing protein n=1 Tax=Bionectria ochroleuca TaxID=29856 RepID=A0A8H7NN94_BIOOC
MLLMATRLRSPWASVQANLCKQKYALRYLPIVSDLSRLSWNPVIFTFSFTKKELQTQPLTTLQDRFENLDIKLLTEYSAKYTTHVVSKKRNTAKGLQALINGKYIVTETFLDAVVEAAAAPVGDGSENSALEQDYEASWPDPIKHLPPRGGEPVQHPDETYSPDPERREVFEGYTFIFYDKAQYDNLLAPITNGGGKAFMEIVEGGETEVDDFVNRVKAIAGEQALGDGGKGAVLVRFVPAKGEQIPWYTDFFTAVSLRLDHRPIEQSEFLEAILIKDASILRRPLEVDDSVTTQPPQPDANTRQEPVRSGANSASQDEPQVIQESRSAPRRGRTRTAVKRRFAGFDNDSDIDMDDTPSVPPPRAMQPHSKRSKACSCLKNPRHHRSLQGLPGAAGHKEKDRLRMRMTIWVT